MVMRKENQIMKIINMSLIDLPAPSSISYMWNYGSLLSVCLMTQILSGLFLIMQYTADISLSFEKLSFIQRDVNYGWLLRYLHANGASMFFIMIYLHIARGIYYSSYLFMKTWLSGIMILLILMGTAFLGYVLPWGQMSFWGATVITNLMSAIPYLGESMTYWVWGGFSISNNSLTRFMALHFLLPFILLLLVVIHITFLHSTGSNNPTGIPMNIDKIPFHPYFMIKDILGMLVMTLLLILIVLLYPNILSDPENYTPANPMNTPPHIQPEWYFLFAYAILRSIPNKLGGVMALLMSILILASLPLSMNNKFKQLYFYPYLKMMFWTWSMIFIMLTYLGSCPIEYPYVMMGQLFTILYFMFFIIMPLTSNSY